MLDELIEAARVGESRVLVVHGEAGVGKTALLGYLGVGASLGMSGVAGHRCPSEMELAFAGLHQLCAPMLDRLVRLPVPQCAALQTAFGLDRGSAPDRFMIGLAVLGLLADAAEEHPLICLVDDEQWLDHASAQVLGFVARRLSAEPVALVFGARVPGEELAGLPELVIEGLGQVDARALLDAALTGPLDALVRDRIVARDPRQPAGVILGQHQSGIEVAALSLNSNLAALRAARSLQTATADVSSLFERLSSGLRINHASDDPAGLAEASTLRTAGRVYTQATRNVNDSISFFNVAESATSALKNILDRMGELATQASNGVLSDTQRQSLDEESQSLQTEYGRILTTAKFNGTNVFTTGELATQAGFGAKAVILADISGGSSTTITISTTGTDTITTTTTTTTTTTVGDGTFQAKQSFAHGNQPYSVARRLQRRRQE